MSNELNPLSDRLQDLLVSKVTEGWNVAEEREFEQTDWSSLETSPDQQLEELEQAAAAFALVFEESALELEDVSLPAELQSKILADAKSTLAGTQKIDSEALQQELSKRPAPSEQAVYKTNSSAYWRESFAWVALAASLLFIILNISPTQPTLTPSQQMAKLTQTPPTDLVEVEWQNVASKSASGRVVWSDEKQEGYMVFKDLEINDPTEKQYQLWIFDTDASQAHPVDGGVFDVSKAGEVVVPIDAKIKVDKAVMFAVTVEYPGGVVVSKRETIPVLAIVDPEKK